MGVKRNFLNYTLPILMGAGMIFAVLWGKSKAVQAEELRKASDEYTGYCVSACARTGRELCGKAEEMSLSLDKLRILNSLEGKVLALEDIVRESAEAEKLITRLPRSQVESMGLAAFLTRTGDYARCLSKKLLAGEELPAKDGEQLETLIETFKALSERLNTMLENGELPVGTEDFDYYDTDGETEENGFEYPELDYDGPYSRAAEEAEPKGLSGAEGTEEEAKDIAEALAGTRLFYEGRSEGRLPAYDFSAEGVEASVTCRGLTPLYFMKAPEGDTEGEPGEEEKAAFVSSAESFLGKAGFENMAPAYFRFEGGAALISFCPECEGVLVRGDTVKVWVDRETGAVCGMDAREYVFNHRERTIEAPRLGESEAREALSPALQIKSARLSLVPVSPMTETLCWEFRCSLGEDGYVVFINAQNGREELVRKIVNDGNGERLV